MNKTPRFSKSGIEYLDYSWGIFSGCYNLPEGICPVEVCWAKGIALHYPKLYPNGFNPTYYPEALDSPKYRKKPSRIGVGWVGDVIGYGLEYKEQIYETIRACPQHTFLFLTKNPENLPQWSPFPENCYVGVTATGVEAYKQALAGLAVIKAKVKFLSIEPFLERIPMVAPYELSRDEVQQVIIGAQTKPYRPPAISAVHEIVEACDKAGVKVFLKENLKDLLRNEQGWTPALYVNARECDGTEYLRQEMPVSG